MPDPDERAKSTPVDMKAQVELADSLRGANLRGYKLDELEARLRTFLKVYRTIAIGTGPSVIWYRGRPCLPGGFPNVRECLYPPAEKLTQYGRANYPREPVFYGASNPGTVFNEVMPETSDVVQLVAVRLRPGKELRCVVVGEIEHFLCWYVSSRLRCVAGWRRQDDRGLV